MKVKTLYCCQNCGFSSPKWLGRCPSCEAWNTLVEELAGGALQAGQEAGHAEGSLAALREEFKTVRGNREKALDEETGLHGPLLHEKDWVLLDENPDNNLDNNEESTSKKQSQKNKRLSTGLSELDRALGGGLVPDSLTLLGGDPGIGKSTLLLQMAKGVSEKNPDASLLYVTGEESIDQIRSRALRLGVRGKNKIHLAAETQLERVFSIIKELKPNIVVMDSLQTFSSGFIGSAPGSVGQLREVACRLMALAKTAGIAVWLVGHVTKDGSIAGPKTVEHMVDTVLYFEGEGGQNHRLLRTVKNRFGSTFELGVFEMTGEGLQEVANPSSLFLSDRKNAIAGTAIAASLEGTRPLFVELQALVVPSPLALPRRTSVGLDSSRVSLLAAILERHVGVALSQHDLFFNVAGGMRLSEPSCDLAAIAAIWSSRENRSVPHDCLWIGEVGLTGEVRRVPQLELRLQEAVKLGFKKAVVPAASEKSLKPQSKNAIHLIAIDHIRHLRECLKAEGPGGY